MDNSCDIATVCKSVNEDGYVYIISCIVFIVGWLLSLCLLFFNRNQKGGIVAWNVAGISILCGFFILHGKNITHFTFNKILDIESESSKELEKIKQKEDEAEKINEKLNKLADDTDKNINSVKDRLDVFTNAITSDMQYYAKALDLAQRIRDIRQYIKTYTKNDDGSAEVKKILQRHFNREQELHDEYMRVIKNIKLLIPPKIEDF